MNSDAIGKSASVSLIGKIYLGGIFPATGYIVNFIKFIKLPVAVFV